MIHLKQSIILILGIPVAPEGRHKDFSLFGDQYSNFNAGKILLILEVIGGLHYSTADDSFTFAENLPKGQLISKGLFGFIIWTKHPTKFFKDFLP